MGRTRKLTKKLLEKSKGSFVLALEVFNKPTVQYRVEAFSILFINAWEILLKARIYEINKGKKSSIYYRKKRNKKRKSLSLDDCLKKIFPNHIDPIRKNIEYISEIRNASIHLILDELIPYFSRVFQSGIFNYIEFLNKWFGIQLTEYFSPGLISLVSDTENLKNLTVLKKHLNKEDFRIVANWVSNFQKLEKLGNKATISIEHSFALIKNPRKADIVLSSGGNGEKAIVVNKFRDLETSYPYRRKEAMQIIKGSLDTKIKFTNYYFEAYCFVRGIKKNTRNEYCWKPKFSSPRFSEKLVQELITFINSNPNKLNNIKKQYREYLNSRRVKK